MVKKIRKTEEEWKKILTPEQYRIMREKGTEPEFSCAWRHDAPGVYHCAACGLPLFRSESKYESGTGWPSYFEPVNPEHIIQRDDTSHGMRRIEVRCAQCDSHLGHMFLDGPPPMFMRYCINSLALTFHPHEE